MPVLQAEGQTGKQLEIVVQCHSVFALAITAAEIKITTRGHQGAYDRAALRSERNPFYSPPISLCAEL